MSRLLIYGATGYVGRMAAEHAQSLGLDFIIAGRNPDTLSLLSGQLNTPYRVFAPDSVQSGSLEGVGVVLNLAGPFARTAEPLMLACMAAGVDYLDITAEINVYRLAEELDQTARQAGVMLLPGVGWDVVPTDCLAVHVARRVKNPRLLRMALQVAGSMSRGSASSVSEILGAGLLKRMDGRLVSTPNADMRYFDFGAGAVPCAPLSFGDLVTAWHSTGIPDIEMFVHVTGDAFPTGDLSNLPDGPTAVERKSHPARAVAEITGADGTVARSVIETVNGYTFTPLSAVNAAQRVLAGQRHPGFKTPARVFGADFAATIAGARIIDH